MHCPTKEVHRPAEVSAMCEREVSVRCDREDVERMCANVTAGGHINYIMQTRSGNAQTKEVGAGACAD